MSRNCVFGRILALLACLAGITAPVQGAEALTPNQPVPKIAATLAETDAYKGYLRYGTLAALPVLTLAYGIKFWDWGNHDTWRWSQESEWGHNSDSGGSDKVGHAFAHYTIARATYHLFNYTESGGRRAWAYSFITSAFVGTLIEVGDAYTDKYGFSLGDLTADLVGISTGLLLERYPRIERVIGFSFEYWPSRGYRENGRGFRDISTDNSGWRYMANIKPAGLIDLGVPLPRLMRYFTIDLGFFIRGYTEYERSIGNLDGKRHLFYGVSLNVPEVLRALLKDSAPTVRKVVTVPFEFYHLPLGVSRASSIDD